ncbi:MAG TPA: PAS domain S-box protein [Petrotogaceae bacterium]|nr:PAS domain S-box protein [Petrotogaceae bacterium]HQC40855.1 PAS domain S-box protein [Petrotogaceae bacterium]
MKDIKLLSEIGLILTGKDDSDKKISMSIEKIGKHFNVSRVYIFLDEDDSSGSSSYEWCNENISSKIGFLKEFKYEAFPGLREIFLRREYLYVNITEENDKNIYQILKNQSIHSLIIFPLFFQDSLRGFIGCDDCLKEHVWSVKSIEFFKTLASLVSNILEVKNYQETLRNSELNTRTFFNTVEDLFFIGDMEGNILHVNTAVIKKLRYTLEQLKRKKIWDIHPKDRKEEIKELMKSVFLGDRTSRLLPLITSENNIIYVETRIWAAQWNGKESIFVISKDVTKENILLNKLKNVFENNPASMSIRDFPTGIFTDANEVFLNKYGYKKTDILGKTLEEIGIFIDEATNKEIEQELLKNGKVSLREVRITTSSGRIIQNLFTGAILDDLNKKSFLTVTIDVTGQKQAEDNLKEAEKRFSLALEGAEMGLWDWDMINNKVYFSKLWKSMLGYDENEIENSFEGWKKLWHEDDVQKIEKAIKDYLNGKTEKYEIIHRLKTKNNSWKWILTRGSLLRQKDGTPYRWVGTNVDITNEKERSDELERFFSVNLDLLCIADIDGNFLKVNSEWINVLGYSREYLEKSKFLDFVHPDDIPNTLEAMSKLSQQHEVVDFVNRYRAKNDEYRYIEWRSHPYGKIIYAAARDITDKIETEKKYREIAIRDPLTEVYNRRHLFERLSSMISEHTRTKKDFSVAILDIDFFKKINDTFGHQAGDYILKEFTKTITHNLRPYDVLGRYGGEEFMIILDWVSKETALIIVERILTDVRQKKYVYGDATICFTFSAGISDCKDAEEDFTVEKLVEKADSRLYSAKHSGRNTIIITD